MANVVSAFWKNKKVFLTGHTGFKGSWLSLWLTEMGAKVSGYSLAPNTNPSLFQICRLEDRMTSEIGDIRDLENLKKSIARAKPDLVIHMAAQALVRPSYLEPVDTYMINIMGTVHLLEACRGQESIRAIVNVTSDKCYENQEREKGYEENEAMGGYDPYSSSKGCAELVTSSYRRSFFAQSNCAVASARAGNVIGGGDWAQDRLIPDIMKAISENRPVVIRNPNAIRPWQHVLEPLSGYLILAERLFQEGHKYAEAFNFGPAETEAQPVLQIVERMTKRWGSLASYQIDEKAAHQFHEAHYLRLDCKKAQRVLNWHPRWSLVETIDKIIEWHREFQDHPKHILEFTLKQISSYEKSNHEAI